MKRSIGLWLVLGAFILSCQKNQNDLKKPIVNEISPAVGSPGTGINITGSNFSPVLTENNVKFGSATAEIIEASETKLVVEVPEGAATGPVVVAINGQQAANRPTFFIMTCEDFQDLTYSNFNITEVNEEEGEIFYELDIKNEGEQPLDLTRVLVQNYISESEESSNVEPAGGSIIPLLISEKIMMPQQILHIEYRSVKTGPYLVVVIKARDLEGIDCHEEINITTKVQ